ncbi:hypothetical protein [Peribacillus butanolivorans]|uniref:hypothetical protein n=1 Tax=Peribacillus butanolivorans TaxID=421767 RepID=UPI0035D59EB3
MYAFNSSTKEDVVKLNSKLELISEIDNQQKYKFSVQAIEKGKQQIKFHLKNDINIVLEKLDVETENISQDALVYNIPVREKGETITLESGKELVYPIEVELDKLTSGKYELEVKFSAENVEVDKQTVEIVVK